MAPVGRKVSDRGSNSSAVERFSPLRTIPPVTSTSPLGRSVAACAERGDDMLTHGGQAVASACRVADGVAARARVQVAIAPRVLRTARDVTERRERRGEGMDGYLR